MRKSISFYYLILIAAIFILITYTKKNSNTLEKSDLNFLIQINTLDSSILINNNLLKNFELEKIEKILGEPSRIMCDTFQDFYEEFGYDDISPTSTPYTSHNYYYIYDSIGIMFYTNNGMYETKIPEIFSIHFKNKREFTNTPLSPYEPKNSFKGILEVNEEFVNDDKKIVPKGTDYFTENFSLYNILFGHTSISMNIDRLFSIGSKPHIIMHLNNDSDQKISYITIK